MDSDTVKKQILFGSKRAGKTYSFDNQHDMTQPAQKWFQRSDEGLILFVVFYTQACRWSRCLGCNLPSLVSKDHVPFNFIMAQVDNLFGDSEVKSHCNKIKKFILSNNGSVLDEDTFSSTALMYLISQLNLYLPNLSVLSMETRPEYVDIEELEFMSRALAEGETPTQLEITIGFEAFDDHVRNQVFDKGLSLETFENLVVKMAPYGFHLKCYFMQKPVPGISDKEALSDIQKAIDFLDQMSRKYGIEINMHLNPTYVAKGTALETAFKSGKFRPPRLEDVARAALYSRDKNVSIFIGLSDEGLALPGGSFLTPENEYLIKPLEEFNRTQKYQILERISA